MKIVVKDKFIFRIVFVHNIIMSRGVTRRMILSIDFKLDMLGTTNYGYETINFGYGTGTFLVSF